MKVISIIISLFISFNIQASEVTHLRNDQTVPLNCQKIDIANFFSDDMEYYTYSRTGGERRGFDYEIDISRGDIRNLWDLFRGSGHSGPQGESWANSSEQRRMYFDMIKNNFEAMDFDFNEEGQILEILAVVGIRESLDDDYFVTGSVAYSGNKTTNRIGELDIVVGKKSSCEVSYVGEVKINPKRLGKARSQLSRFKNFIKSEKRGN